MPERQWWDATPGRRIIQQRCAKYPATAGGQLWHETGQPHHPNPDAAKAIRNENGLYLAIGQQPLQLSDELHGPPAGRRLRGSELDLFSLRHLN